MHNTQTTAYIIPKGGMAVIWDWLLLFITAYLLAILSIHLIYKFIGVQPDRKHIVVITFNDQANIEWVLRSLFIFSWLKGKPLTVTIVDQASVDDTRHIIRHFAYKRSIEWVPLSNQEEVDGWLQQNSNDRAKGSLEVFDLRDNRSFHQWSYSSSGEN
jgi:hypothetical protein